MRQNVAKSPNLRSFEFYENLQDESNKTNGTLK